MKSFDRVMSRWSWPIKRVSFVEEAYRVRSERAVCLDLRGKTGPGQAESRGTLPGVWAFARLVSWLLRRRRQHRPGENHGRYHVSGPQYRLA